MATAEEIWRQIQQASATGPLTTAGGGGIGSDLNISVAGQPGINVPGTGQRITNPGATGADIAAAGMAPATPPAPSSPTDLNAMMSPATGWAATQNFTPAMMESIFSNPWYLASRVFQGIDTASPGYQALRDIGGDPLTLFNIMQGSGRNITEANGANEFANFMANLYQNLGTAGGRGLNGREMIRAIFGEDVSGGELGPDGKPKAGTSSTLGNILNAGDMGQQVRTLFNMLRDVASTTMNPLAAAGYQSAIARAGDVYGSEMLSRDAGNTPHITEWMNQFMPGLTVR